MAGAFLALDWGEKKVGYATADADGLVVTPRGHFKRKPQKNAKWILESKDLKELQHLIDEFEIKNVILGLPLLPSGRENDSTMGAKELADQLKKAFQMPVILINEALTSWESRGSKDVDAQSAALLLEDYFSARSRKV